MWKKSCAFWKRQIESDAARLTLFWRENAVQNIMCDKVEFVALGYRSHELTYTARVHTNTRAAHRSLVFTFYRSLHANIHFKRNCAQPIVISEGPGCGRRVDKRIAIPSGGGGESASRCFWQGSHKLNTNWHTRGALVVFHAFNFHCVGHCV